MGQTSNHYRQAMHHHPDVVARLREWLANRPPTHPEYLFPVSKPTCGFDRRTSIMMKRDLAAARKQWIDEADDKAEKQRRAASDFLKYVNSRGLFADFHTNRHTFITNLSRAGLSPKVVQTLARHSDIRLTMNVYSHTDLREQQAAVEKLPQIEGRRRVGPPVSKPKTEGRAAKKSKRNQPLQRHSSTSAAEDVKDSPLEAEPGKTEDTASAKRDCRKSLKIQDLAPNGSKCPEKEEARPAGFEPATLGSEGNSSIDVTANCIKDLRQFEECSAAPQQHVEARTSQPLAVDDAMREVAAEHAANSRTFIPPQLARFIRAWDSVPPHAQESILLLLNSVFDSQVRSD